MLVKLIKMIALLMVNTHHNKCDLRRTIQSCTYQNTTPDNLFFPAIAMACGWLVCITIASLPLFEISDYRKFANCLPFETGNSVSLGKYMVCLCS